MHDVHHGFTGSDRNGAIGGGGVFIRLGKISMRLDDQLINGVCYGNIILKDFVALIFGRIDRLGKVKAVADADGVVIRGDNGVVSAEIAIDDLQRGIAGQVQCAGHSSAGARDGSGKAGVRGRSGGAGRDRDGTGQGGAVGRTIHFGLHRIGGGGPHGVIGVAHEGILHNAHLDVTGRAADGHGADAHGVSGGDLDRSGRLCQASRQDVLTVAYKNIVCFIIHIQLIGISVSNRCRIGDLRFAQENHRFLTRCGDHHVSCFQVVLCAGYGSTGINGAIVRCSGVVIVSKTCRHIIDLNGRNLRCGRHSCAVLRSLVLGVYGVIGKCHGAERQRHNESQQQCGDLLRHFPVVSPLLNVVFVPHASGSRFSPAYHSFH